MSESYDESATPETSPETSPTDAQGGPTGEARVDAVLASLEVLDRTPVTDHVAVLEAALAELRSSLDDAPVGDVSGPSR